MMINIFYYLAKANEPGFFNIPAELVATSAHTTREVVYGFITELVRKAFLKVEVKEDIKNGRGRLFRWLEEPVN